MLNSGIVLQQIPPIIGEEDMSPKAKGILIESAALDETPSGAIILRGVVHQSSLQNLQVDDYQREALPLTALSSILDALALQDSLPDIELGMRGQRFKEVSENSFELSDPVFIIDGLQRVNGAIHHMSANSEKPPRLGVVVHFSTTREWERERFRILNSVHTKVSPNVLLRNMRDESRAISMLYSLSSDKNFVMFSRITWAQRMAKGELITALMFAKAVARLHSHKAPTKRSALNELVPALDKAVEVVGIQNMRDNARCLFNLIDECWGIKRIQYREGAAYVKSGFLNVLASLLSDHYDFWKGDDERQLSIEASLKKKIALFPVNDPQVINLASSSSLGNEMLYVLLRNHINSGKRSKRLSSRTGDVISLEDEKEENNIEGK